MEGRGLFLRWERDGPLGPFGPLGPLSGGPGRVSQRASHAVPEAVRIPANKVRLHFGPCEHPVSPELSLLKPARPGHP